VRVCGGLGRDDELGARIGGAVTFIPSVKGRIINLKCARGIKDACMDANLCRENEYMCEIHKLHPCHGALLAETLNAMIISDESFFRR